MIIGLIIAGGIGQRMGQEIPKQFINVNDKPVIIYTLEAFQKNNNIDVIAVVCVKGWEYILDVYAKQFNITKLKHIIIGGDCGQASIRNGIFELEKFYNKDDIILIHDAIRPMINDEIIDNCIETTKTYGNAITVIPCAEAMLITDDKISSNSSYPRDNLKRTQTPQGFYLKDICDLHREALEKGITDSIASCTLMIELNKVVYFSKGSEKNIKLTTVEDLDIFKALLQSKRAEWLR